MGFVSPGGNALSKHAYFAAAILAAAALAAPVQASEPTSRAPGDKIICKRFTPVGSFARPKKTCKTAAEWQLERDTARAEGQRLTEQMSGEREVAEIRPSGSPN